RQAAEDLVHQPQIALHVPDERDLAAIEMGEVDSGREDRLAAIFRMLDHAAAQHRYRALRIESREIDRDLGFIECRAIFGIEEARIAQGDDRGATVPLDGRCRELDLPAGAEFVEPRQRLRPRQQHRMAKMRAARRTAEHMREKDAVIDLQPALRLLLERVLGRKGFGRGHQARHRARRVEDQPLDADKRTEIVGQRAIDRLDMRREKALPRYAGRLDRRHLPPELAEALNILPIVSADRRRGLIPFAHGAFSSAVAAAVSGTTWCWARGSSASCSPSPRKLQAITVTKINSPG